MDPTLMVATQHAATFAIPISEAIDVLEKAGHGFATIILCPDFLNEGFPRLAPDWLDAALALIRKRGGLSIADEVQPGFGRNNEGFWGHQRIGDRPDIVVLGNSHLVAACSSGPK